MTDPKTGASHVRIMPAGDAAIVVQFDERMDPAINTVAIALARAIRGQPGIRDAVAAYRSVTVFFDPLQIEYPDLVSRLEQAVRDPVEEHPADARSIDVSVVYGGSFGPDLGDIAARSRMTEAAVIALHSEARYRVFMLGFMPGFAYMGVVDERIAVPRLASPRVKVPAGSVAIAGAQTGIYPFDTPGGWRIVGRTPLKPYDPSRSEPFLFRPGDVVRFVPVEQWPS